MSAETLVNSIFWIVIGITGGVVIVKTAKYWFYGFIVLIGLGFLRKRK